MNKKEKNFIKWFLLWATGFVGCGIIFIILFTILRNTIFNYKFDWPIILSCILLGLFFIFLGRKHIQYRSIYYWFIFIIVGGEGLIRIFFWSKPLLRIIATVIFFSIICAWIVFKSTKKKFKKQKTR